MLNLTFVPYLSTPKHTLLGPVLDCTYTHFENNSQCPSCRATLGESDFTELVVADNNGTDLAKTTMQTLFTKKSSSGNLQYSDICQTLINQIDMTKSNTKFLLKQLLVESHRAGRMSMNVMRSQASLKAENTQLKQSSYSQRLKYEQTINDLQNKLQARESTISEQNGIIGRFQKHHGVGGGSGGSSMAHMVPNSSNVSLASGRGGNGSGGPLHGLMKRQAENKIAHQNTMNGINTQRGPFMNNMNMNRSKTSPANTFRPFSSNSSGGGSIASSARGIRDLSAGQGYHFSGSSQQHMGSSQQHMNKRRRGGTPTGSLDGTPHNAMSPNTAFALNQGPHGRNVFHGRR